VPSASPETLEAVRCQFSVPNSMLDIAVPQVGLQGARVVPLVGKGVAAGVPEHVRVSLEANLASTRARSTMRAKPTVVNGAPAAARR
jgi:hypothetical protein